MIDQLVLEILRSVQERPWAMHRPTLEAALARLRAGITPPPPEAARATTRAGSVAVVPIYGPIRQKGSMSYFDSLFGGVASTERIGETLRQLVTDESVGSIVLDIDSPGGEVYGVAELGDEIFKLRGTKPLVAIANSEAFSAAYWIGSQADELVVTPGGEVGSIGVWTLHIDWSEWDKASGLDFTYIYAGKYKVAANPDEPLSDEARELLQADVDRYYDMFVNAVARGRGAKASAVRSDFGEGWTVGAKDAVSSGMADRVGTFNETIARLAGSSPARGARADDIRERRLRRAAIGH